MKARPKYARDYVPQRAVLYCRISDARAEDTTGVDSQGARLEAFARDVLRWGVLAVLIENDTSAFKRRKVTLPDGDIAMRVIRPEFRKALQWLRTGAADGFVALDLDRALRDPRDLEDLIDIVEAQRIPVRSITGSLRLDTDADITMARVMTAIANKSSRDTARRVAERREDKARAGIWGGGKRPFGFEADGVTPRPGETVHSAAWAYQVLQGASLRSIAKEARQAGVIGTNGADISPETVSRTLLSPRMAGRMVYHGEDVGPAPWEPIVPYEVWRAVVEILTDEDRRLGPGPAPRWLGTNRFVCGKCESLMAATGGGTSVNGERVGATVYRCKAATHLSRNAVKVDAYIRDVILARVLRDDAVDLLNPAEEGVDVEALRAEAMRLRENLAEMARDRAVGDLTRAEHLEGSRAVKVRLATLEESMASSLVESPLQQLVEAEDAIAMWDGMALSGRQIVLGQLMTVEILPVRGKFNPKVFCEDAIKIHWVHGE